MNITGATFWDFLIAFKLPIWIIVILTIVAFCIAHAENLLAISGAIAGLFSRFSKKASKKQISAEIRSGVIKASKAINVPSSSILPRDLKIKWADNDDIESFFDDNCVVLRLKKSSNPNENYVNVIFHFVVAGLLSNQRHYFNEQIMKATDLLITQKIISLAKPSANAYFLDNIFKPLTDTNQSLVDDYNSIKGIDFNGMLFNVYLNELAKAVATIIGQVPDPCLQAESGEFLRFLYRIATRTAEDETVELNIKSNYFQIGIVLAVSNKTLRKSGWSAHYHYIQRLLSENYRTVYIFGIGKKASIASNIAYAVKDSDDRVVKTITHKYKHINKSTGVRYDAVCIELDTY